MYFSTEFSVVTSAKKVVLRSVCLFLETSCKKYTSILPQMTMYPPDSGSHPHMDPDLGIFEGFFNNVRFGIFHNVAHISGKTDRIFTEMLERMHLDQEQPWRSSALSECSRFRYLSHVENMMHA